MDEIESVALYPRITSLIPIPYLENYIHNLPIALEAIRQNADIFIKDKIPILIEEPYLDPNDWYITNIGMQYNCTIVTDDLDLLNMKNPAIPVISIKDFFQTIS